MSSSIEFALFLDDEIVLMAAALVAADLIFALMPAC